MNMAFHNYQEFNYYEFDVDFDIHSYATHYMYATYIHVGILIYISKKKNKRNMLIMLMLLTFITTQYATILEIMYYACVILISSEIQILLYIFNKKLKN
jgi:hypothetical protein